MITWIIVWIIIIATMLADILIKVIEYIEKSKKGMNKDEKRNDISN